MEPCDLIRSMLIRFLMDRRLSPLIVPSSLRKNLLGVPQWADKSSQVHRVENGPTSLILSRTRSIRTLTHLQFPCPPSRSRQGRHLATNLFLPELRKRLNIQSLPALEQCGRIHSLNLKCPSLLAEPQWSKLSHRLTGRASLQRRC
jgi:hypothetical protein